MVFCYRPLFRTRVVSLLSSFVPFVRRINGVQGVGPHLRASTNTHPNPHMALGCYQHRPTRICDTFASHVHNKQVLQRTHSPSLQCSPQLGSSVRSLGSLLAYRSLFAAHHPSLSLVSKISKNYRCVSIVGRLPLLPLLPLLLLLR